MAFITKAFTTTCPSELMDALNADGNIAPDCFQIISIGDGNSTFEFATALSGGEDSYLDSFLAAWVCVTAPGDPQPGGDPEVIDDGQTGSDTSWSSEKIQEEINNAQGGIPGLIHQMQFHEASSVSNEWLEFGTAGIYSNSVWGIMPFKSKLIALTYSNKVSGADCRLKFYSTPEGGGASPRTMDVDWTLTNVRCARKTNFGTDIIYEAGDKIGVYHVDQGTNSDDVVVMMYFQIIEDNDEEVKQNFSGNFSSSGSS